jgi:hypothetical protein
MTTTVATVQGSPCGPILELLIDAGAVPCAPASVLCTRCRLPLDRQQPAFRRRSQATTRTLTRPSHDLLLLLRYSSYDDGTDRAGGTSDGFPALVSQRHATHCCLLFKPAGTCATIGLQPMVQAVPKTTGIDRCRPNSCPDLNPSHEGRV